MKKILVLFVVTVSFVFAANVVLVAAPPSPSTAFEDTEGPVVSATLNYPSNNSAIFGTCRSLNGFAGIYGRAEGSNSRGVYGEAPYVGVYGKSYNSSGIGVYGYVAAATGTTYGVYGKSDSLSGIGVYGQGKLCGVQGWNTIDGGTGVFGCDISNTPNSYGIYSLGKAKVDGSLVVTGQLYVSSINITGAIPTYTNLAQTVGATITTDSYYNDNYSPEKARDGIICRWDEGEWASLSKGAVYYRDLRDPSGRAWLQLDWPVPGQNINTIKIYDRPNKYDKILDAWLLVRRNDGTTTDLHLGMFPYGGAPKVINLTSAEGTNVTSIKLTITEVGPDTLNVGVSEIECFRDRSLW